MNERTDPDHPIGSWDEWRTQRYRGAVPGASSTLVEVRSSDCVTSPVMPSAAIRPRIVHAGVSKALARFAPYLGAAESGLRFPLAMGQLNHLDQERAGDLVKALVANAR